MCKIYSCYFSTGFGLETWFTFFITAIQNFSFIIPNKMSILCLLSVNPLQNFAKKIFTRYSFYSLSMQYRQCSSEGHWYRNVVWWAHCIRFETLDKWNFSNRSYGRFLRCNGVLPDQPFHRLFEAWFWGAENEVKVPLVLWDGYQRCLTFRRPDALWHSWRGRYHVAHSPFSGWLVPANFTNTACIARNKLLV